MTTREPACARGLAFTRGGEGHYVTALLSALPHLCEAYCRADLSNQPGSVETILALFKQLLDMNREGHGREIVLGFLGSKEGTELLKAVDRLATEQTRAMLADLDHND